MSTNITDQLSNVVLRIATPADRPALQRLAERDSDVVPALPILLAESGGRLAAAWSMSEQRAIADPFAPTAHLIALLREHAGAGSPARGRRRLAPPSLRTLGHAGPRAA
jgi:hypothetical protein